jgi:hypothetical protein
MFGRKAKEIKRMKVANEALSKSWDVYYNRALVAERDLIARLDSIGNLEAQLDDQKFVNAALSTESRELAFKLDLLQSVLKQLNIPVKLKK